jgi:tetratricopeptide (TPR) repeat protein
MTKNAINNILTALLLALLSPLALADALNDQAKGLLDQGKAKEAYQLLESAEGARAGDPAFDLLFGIAAVDIGQNTRGVFALERVLALQPNNARARAEIARAYLALGETKTARQEFETVQKQGVPPEVSSTIERYLAAVDRLDGVTRTTVRGYLEAALGYDTNVNAGPNKNAVAIPGFGGLPFTLAANSKANEDTFGTVGGGFTVRQPLNPSLALVAGLSGTQRQNFSKDTFNSLSIDANAGIVFSEDKSVYSLTAQYNEYNLKDTLYRAATGVTGQWQFNADARNQYSAFGQYSDLRYPGQSVRNAERWVGGAAYAHALRTGEILFASAYVASEKERAGSKPYLGHIALGVRFGGQMNYNAETVLFAGGSVEQRRYGGTDPSFLTTREDTQWDLSIGANYIPAKDWKVTPKLSVTQNQSNTELNEYRREVVSVTVRRDF